MIATATMMDENTIMMNNCAKCEYLMSDDKNALDSHSECGQHANNGLVPGSGKLFLKKIRLANYKYFNRKFIFAVENALKNIL